MGRPMERLFGPARRHPVRSFLALALLLLAVGAAAGYWWSQHHFHAAQQALDRRAFDDAQHHLDLCLWVPYRRAAVHLLAAQAARRRDAYDEAARHLAACGRIEEMDSAIALERWLLTAQQGDLDDVEGLLQARTGPSDPAAVLVLEALAKGYVNRHWYTHALVCLTYLLERQPDHAQALVLRGRMYEHKAKNGAAEHEEDALRDYQQAVELSPTFEARLGLAGTLYRVGRPWDSAEEFEQLRQQQQANVQVLLGLARARYSLGEVDEARQLLDELLAREPENPEALLERGRLAFHAGQLAEAEGWLRQAVAAAPAYDAEPQRFLHQCLEAQHKDEEARRCLEQLRKRESELFHLDRLVLQATRDPANVDLRYQVAMELMRLGREDDAVATLFFVVNQAPRHGPAHAALADYLERTGQPRRASPHRRASFPGAGAVAPSR